MAASPKGPNVWVVAVDESERATALAPPADAFFDILVPLVPWEPDQLRDLLIRRASGAPAEAIDLIAKSARGNPRLALQALSRAIVSGLPPGDWLKAGALLQMQASELGWPQSMLLTELLQRGRASPSDDDLQASLGVTRARLAQLFSELQAAGLVIQYVAKADGPGRPRSVYRPRLPA